MAEIQFERRGRPLPEGIEAVREAVAAGAGTPLVSGTVRALWSRVDPAVRGTAYALDATATELVFVAGPTVVAALAVLAAGFIALARLALATMERRAREEGTLTDRRR